MAAKTQINKIIDTDVNSLATDIWESPIIPNTKEVVITNFGGFDAILADGISGIIGLQWGSTGAWETIRGGGYGVFNFENLNLSFTGDGVKKFRIVRINKSSAVKRMTVWAYGRVNDA